MTLNKIKVAPLLLAPFARSLARSLARPLPAIHPAPPFLPSSSPPPPSHFRRLFCRNVVRRPTAGLLKKPSLCLSPRSSLRASRTQSGGQETRRPRAGGTDGERTRREGGRSAEERESNGENRALRPPPQPPLLASPCKSEGRDMRRRRRRKGRRRRGLNSE